VRQKAIRLSRRAGVCRRYTVTIRYAQRPVTINQISQATARSPRRVDCSATGALALPPPILRCESFSRPSEIYIFSRRKRYFNQDTSSIFPLLLLHDSNEVPDTTSSSGTMSRKLARARESRKCRGRNVPASSSCLASCLGGCNGLVTICSYPIASSAVPNTAGQNGYRLPSAESTFTTRHVCRAKHRLLARSRR